jgi:hypothetical protein|tara:strand:- start:375 stop:803 length:429 start_codon:yes stop_codon:yes gene_type:complete
MEKDKNQIGHNSNLLLEDAFKETLKDAYKASRAADKFCLKLWSKFNQFVKGEAELTEKQQNWNFHVDTHNNWIMDIDPDPRTNKKRLRKKYKPAKLSKAEKQQLQKEIEKDFEQLWELSSDPAAYMSGSEHPLMKEVTDEKK